MEIRVRLFGPQAQAVGERAVTVELPGGTSQCAAVRRALAVRYPALAATLDTCRFAVNHRFAPDDATVTAGDEVALIGQVSGG